VHSALAKRRPGDAVSITFVGRSGKPTTARMTLAANPHVDVVPIESAGGTLTDAQRTFRQRWIGAK
jgi:hypothetical protein